MGQLYWQGVPLLAMWTGIIMSCLLIGAADASVQPPPHGRQLLTGGTGSVQMTLVDYPPRYTNTSSSWTISWHALDINGRDCPSCPAFCTLNGVDQRCDVLRGPPTQDENGTYVSSKALSPASEEGTYVLDIWGQEPNCWNACANGSATEVSWTYHTDLPVVSITNGPANNAITSLQTETLTLNASSAIPYTLACALDQAPFSDCTTNKTNFTISGLAAGSHTFQVRATDAAGNAGAIVSLTWTVDLRPPTVTILQQPPVLTKSPTAVIAFQGAIGSAVSRCATCTFACTLDGAPPNACAQSPGSVTFSALAQGAHNFTVTVTDPDGNLRAVIAATWLVDLQPPTVAFASAPLARTSADAAAFAFTASDSLDASCANCTFTCQLDAFVPQACTLTQGAKYVGLGVAGATASHSFAIVATDQAGNVSPPTTFNWTVDLVNPSLTVVTQPPPLVNTTRVFLAFTANDSTPTCVDCLYMCQLDNGPIDSCSTGGSIGAVTYVGLLDGVHELLINVTNPVGLTTSQTISWEVDTSDPLPSIDLGASPTNKNPLFAHITFSKPCVNFGFVGCDTSANQTANVTCGGAVDIMASLQSALSVNRPDIVINGVTARSNHLLTVSLTPVANGAYNLSLTAASGVCIDAAGNASPASTGTVTFNGVRGIPLVSTDIPAAITVYNNQTYEIQRTNAGVLNCTVDFGNPVTGFALKSIIVSGGRAGQVTPYVDPTGGTPPGQVYTFSVTVDADGWTRVSIADAAATDTNGNPSLPSATLAVQVDRQPPVFTLTSLSGYQTKDPSIGVLVTLSKVIDEVVTAQFLNVTNANVTAFAGEGGTYGLRLQASPNQLVSVNLPANVVQDRAGNWNLASNTLTIQHYTVPASVAAAAATTTTAVVSTGAVSTGASVAGSMGGVSIGMSGNLLGLFTVIQRFAMMHHLAIKQSVAFTEMTGNFKWANLDAALPFDLGAQLSLQILNSSVAAAPAPAADASPTRRRLLTSSTSPSSSGDVEAVATQDDANRQSAAQQLVSSVIGKKDQGWSNFDRVIGWSLLLVFGSTALHMIVVRLWRMWTEQTIPDILMFPRCEIMVFMLTLEGLAQACGLLIAGGTRNGRLVGSVIFLCVPGSLVTFFFYIVLYKIYKRQAATFVTSPDLPKESPEGGGRSSASMAPTSAKGGALLSRVAAVAALGNLGKPHEGKWQDSESKHFVARYGPLFQSYRGFETQAPEPEEKKPSNPRGKNAKKAAAKRTWGQWFTSIGLGADKFRSCYFSVFLLKKMVYGLLFGMYGGTESMFQVMTLFLYSCVQLAYLMFFKPYLDRSVQAVEEIVLICETVSFFVGILVLARTESGWARTRLSDGTLQTLLLSAQLLSVIVQIVHQWYMVSRVIYSQRAFVLTKLRALFKRKPAACEADEEESARRKSSRARKGSAASKKSRRESESPGEATEGKESRRNSQDDAMLPSASRNSVTSHHSARQSPLLRRRSSRDSEADGARVPRVRADSWHEPRARASSRKSRTSSVVFKKYPEDSPGRFGAFSTPQRSFERPARDENRVAHSKSDETDYQTPSPLRKNSHPRSEPGSDSPRRKVYEEEPRGHSRSPSNGEFTPSPQRRMSTLSAASTGHMPRAMRESRRATERGTPREMFPLKSRDDRRRTISTLSGGPSPRAERRATKSTDDRRRTISTVSGGPSPRAERRATRGQNLDGEDSPRQRPMSTLSPEALDGDSPRVGATRPRGGRRATERGSPMTSHLNEDNSRRRTMQTLPAASPRRPPTRRLALNGSRLASELYELEPEISEEELQDEAPAPIVKLSLQNLKKKAAEGRRARARADVEEPVYELDEEWEEDGESLDRPAFMKPQYYV